MSFDHILKKLDQNDEMKMNMKKTESYKYDIPFQSSCKLKRDVSTKFIKEEKMGTQKTVADKENKIIDCSELDFLEEIDNIPLPPLLNRQSSLDYKLKLLPSPYK